MQKPTLDPTDGKQAFHCYIQFYRFVDKKDVPENVNALMIRLLRMWTNGMPDILKDLKKLFVMRDEIHPEITGWCHGQGGEVWKYWSEYAEKIMEWRLTLQQLFYKLNQDSFEEYLFNQMKVGVEMNNESD